MRISKKTHSWSREIGKTYKLKRTTTRKLTQKGGLSGNEWNTFEYGTFKKLQL